MVDKTFGGCNIDLKAEATERQETQGHPTRPSLPTSPEVEKVIKQSREMVEEGRGIF